MGPFRLVDRAFALLASDPRRLVMPVWSGSAPIVLAALAFYVVERVEGYTGSRAVFAILFALAIGPRTAGWAVAGRTIVLGAEGRDAPLDETRAIVRSRRLALFKAGAGLALFSMPWLFAIALLSLVTPTLALLLLPFAALRWTGAAPTLATRVTLSDDPPGRVYVRAWRDLAGNRATGYAVDLLLWVGTIVVLANGWILLLLVAMLSQEIFGMDLAFAEAFLDPRNGFFTVLLAGAAWLAIEPVRAAIGALLAVDGRVRNEALDLDRMVGELEADRPKQRGTAVAAALVAFFVATPAIAQTLPLPVQSPPPEVELDVRPMPESMPAARPGDDAAREGVRSILARREYREALGIREVGFFDWMRDLFDGFWGPDEEPWDPDFAGLPSIPLPTAWVFVVLAALVLLIVIVALWPRRKVATSDTEAQAEAEPDPRERAPEEIVDEAEALFRAGDVTGALRRIYLATLVALDRRRLISFDPAMTNWQYLRHLPPGEPRTLFAKLCRLFDYKWYGQEPATEAEYREARAIADRLLSSGDDRVAA